MNRIIFLIIGCMLISISNIFFILYLNLFNIGYSILEYLLYCFKHIECLLFIPGMIILYFKYIK